MAQLQNKLCMCVANNFKLLIWHFYLLYCTRVETRSGHPGHPGQLGHILYRLNGSDPLYKISGSDPDSTLYHITVLLMASGSGDDEIVFSNLVIDGDRIRKKGA